MPPEAPDSSRILLALHERFWADREAGKSPSLAEYLALWPNLESVIAGEFLKLTGALPHTEAEAVLGSAVPEIGGRIGHFRLLSELGRGGQGIVYEARDERLQRAVALKVLHTGADPTGTAFLRFQREAAITSRLEHPAICPILEAGREGSTPWIAMKFIPGESLARRLTARREPKRAPPFQNRKEAERIVRWIAAVARALGSAHELGVVHRDLKPGNLMVMRPTGSPEGAGDHGALLRSGETPVMLDFGLARDESQTSADLTASLGLFGTPAYLAPELITARGAKPDRRSDLWALGVTLYECLSLRRPFEGATQDALLRAIVETPIPALNLKSSGLSSDLEVVLITALEKDPARRYQSASALADDLEAALEHRTIAARRPHALGRFTRWAKRKPAHAALALLLAGGVPTVSGLAAYIIATRKDVRLAQETESRQRVQLALERGFLAIEDPDSRAALAHFDEVLQAQPGHEEARLGRLLALKFAGQSRLAVEEFESYGDPANLPASIRRVGANLLLDAGKPTNHLLDTLRSSPPVGPLEKFAVAMDRMSDRNRLGASATREAIELLTDAALSLPTARPTFHYQAAIAASHEYDRVTAMRFASAIEALWPASAESRMVLGFVSQTFRQDDQAVVHYQETLRQNPRQYRAHIGLADIHLRRGDVERALAEYRAAHSVVPEDPACVSGITECCRQLGRLEEVRPLLAAALAKHPNHASLSFSEALIANTEGRRADAIALYQKAIRERGHFPAAQINLGNLFVEAGRPEEAKAAYEQAIRDYPPGDADALPAHLAYGMLLGQSGEHSLAKHHFDTADRLVPDQAPTLYNLGLSHFELGELPPAISLFDRVTRLDPSDQLGWLALAQAQSRSGDTEAALATAQTAMRGKHATSGLCFLAGGWLKAKRQFTEATRAYGQATRLNPEHAEAWCNLGQLYKRAGRFEEALATLRRGHELGIQRPEWPYASDVWIAAVEALMAADAKYSSALTASAADLPHLVWDRLAEIAEYRANWADACRFLESAWGTQAGVFSDAGESLRARAAEAALQAAALASEGQAREWRQRAHRYLHEELDRLLELEKVGRIRAATIVKALDRWIDQGALESFQEPERLQNLPPAEQADWTTLWARIAEVRERAE